MFLAEKWGKKAFWVIGVNPKSGGSPAYLTYRPQLRKPPLLPSLPFPPNPLQLLLPCTPGSRRSSQDPLPRPHHPD